MDDQGLGGSGALLRCVVDLGELKMRTCVGEGWQGPALENLGLELVRCAQPIDELKGQSLWTEIAARVGVARVTTRYSTLSASFFFCGLLNTGGISIRMITCRDPSPNS
jgi:hypothetical protein